MAESLRLPPAKHGGSYGLSKPPTQFVRPGAACRGRAGIRRHLDRATARDPFRDFDKDNELKTELSHELSALAADGVTDAIELREWALEGLSGYR